MKKKTKLFIRYLISFVGVVTLTVSLLIAIVFSVYANHLIRDAKDYSTKQLEQVCDMTDLLYEQMRSISNQILANASTNRCLLTTDFDRLEEATAAIKLREIQSANPGVRYVSFYNSGSNRFVSSSTVDFLTETDVEYYYSALESGSDTCTLRLIGPDYATQQTKTQYVYSFIFKLSVRYNDSEDLAIVDVDENYFTDAINNLRTSDGFQQVLLLDRWGNVFSANTFYEGSESFVQSTYIGFDLEDMPELTGTSGSFTVKLNDGTRALMTYSKAPSSGMTILNIVPYAAIYDGLIQLAFITLLTGLAVLLVGTLASYKTSARLSAPIEILYRNYVQNPSANRREGNELDELSQAFSEMYSKTDKLEQGLIESYSESRKRSIQRLLHGEAGDLSKQAELYQRYGIDLQAPYYCVLMIRCVSRENLFSPDNSNFFICSYALENIVSEVTGQFGSISTYRNSRNLLAVLLPLQTNTHPATLQHELQRVIQVMEQEFDMETTVCIGNIVETAENVNLCYEATGIALENSAIENHGKIFFADDATRSLNLNQYHNKLHIKLAEHIRNENLDACEREFDLAISYMNQISFSTVITYFNHVMMSLLDDFSTTFSDETAYNLLIEQLNRIDHSLPNVNMLRRHCMSFVTLLTHHLSINRKNGNEQAAETARVYIDRNYANPDLSLRMLADLAGLSAAYFGKIFTAHTGLSFNDYLSNTRMKKAAQMLTETKLPINQISEAIGILNTNYFYSVFKKKYNMTPLAYRRMSNRENTGSEDLTE